MSKTKPVRRFDDVHDKRKEYKKTNRSRDKLAEDRF